MYVALGLFSVNNIHPTFKVPFESKEDDNYQSFTRRVDPSKEEKKKFAVRN